MLRIPLHGIYLFRVHLPPRIRDNNMKTMEIHEKAVWSVAIPMARKARPSIRKTVEYRLRGGCFVML